jgi:hypothetical protein
MTTPPFSRQLTSSGVLRRVIYLEDTSSGPFLKNPTGVILFVKKNI